MKRGYAALLVVGVVAVVASPVQAQRGGPGGDREAGQYGWVSSLSRGKDLARQTGKPLMVVVRCVP